MRHAATMCMCLLLISASTGVAQETTGDIFGRVATRHGEPLPGAEVTLENPAVGLSRSAVTHNNGEFRFPVLSPARYRITASLDGFQTIQHHVEVDHGRATTVEMTMEIGSFQATIEVSGERPIIDLSSTVSGLSVDAGELLDIVPVQREVTNIALLAPGTVEAPGFWSQPTRYAGFTPGQGFASFSGASIGENNFQLNGLNVSTFRVAMGSSFVPMEFVEEVRVMSGGYEAEFGRATGGVISMVTKSGTNSLHGGLSAYFEPEGLQEQEPDTFEAHNQDESREYLELNASLGGPLLRDRLFFFAFTRFADTAFVDLYDNHGDLHETSNPYWGGKIDWAIDSSHRLEGTYLSDAVDVDFVRSNYDFETRTLGAVRGTGVRKRGGDNSILKYTGMLGEQLLLSAQAGRNDFNQTTINDGEHCPRAVDHRSDPETPLGCWVTNYRLRDRDARDAYRLDADWFVGNHQLRAGADLELNESRAQAEYSGGVSFDYEINGAPDGDPEDYIFPELPWDQDLVRIASFLHGGRYDVDSSAAYVQDSWRPRADLTLKLGLRWEQYENKNSLGEAFIESSAQWAPRLGAIWDPSGRGRSKLYASAGLFFQPVASIVNLQYASGVLVDRYWYTFDGEINPDGSPSSMGEERSYYHDDGSVPDPRALLSDNFEPTSQVELILGYERSLGGLWTVGARGVARWYDEILEDYTIDQGLWAAYGIACLDPGLVGTGDYCLDTGWRIGNPGRDFQGWYDLDGDGELDRLSIPAAELGYPEAERKHYAIELSFARRFASRWMLQGFYSWSHSYGNYEGPVTSDIPNALAGINQSFDTPAMMEHSRGDLPNDHRHNLKLFGHYAWNFGLQLGGSLSWRTGRPLNSFGQHPSDPLTSSRDYGYYSFYTGGEPRPRGSLGRTPDVWKIDLMLKYAFAAAGLDWNLRADVFNLVNNDAALWTLESAENPLNGVPYEHFGEPIFHQAPRSVRLGFGVNF